MKSCHFQLGEDVDEYMEKWELKEQLHMEQIWYYRTKNKLVYKKMIIVYK